MSGNPKTHADGYKKSNFGVFFAFYYQKLFSLSHAYPCDSLHN